MARWSRGRHHEDLRCHSDAGSQFTSIRYGERLAEIGATPSIGTVGDSYDNALAETVNGYYKTELVRGPARSGPWKTVEDLELATLGWVRGTTRNACMATSATSRPRSSRKRSMLAQQPPTGCWESNNVSLHRTQCGSMLRPHPSAEPFCSAACGRLASRCQAPASPAPSGTPQRNPAR